MDIQEEREAFEAEFSRIKSDIASWVNTWDEDMQGYNHPVMCWFWHMWQAAKAKAVPEGFVLVPKDSLKVALSWMNEDIDPWQMGSDSFAELYEHKPILEALVEAQEQN